MLKSENTVRLQKLLKSRFKATSHQHHAEIIYCEGNVAENITNGESDRAFCFHQAEAYTMIFSAYANFRGSSSKPVVIHSEDTNVYTQAAYVSQKIEGDLLIKSKNNLFDCKYLISIVFASIIIVLGCVHTSGFMVEAKRSYLIS